MKRFVTCILAFATLLCLLSSLLPVATLAAGEGTILLDGKSVAFREGLSLSELCDFDTRRLVWADVTAADGSERIVTDPYEPLSGVTEITTHRISLIADGTAQLRRQNHTGIRFVTSVSGADIDALQSDARVKSVTFGTVILPVDLAVEAADLTHATLGETPHVDVPVTPGAWYRTAANVHFFAGSIYDIKPENVGREFVGRGYVTVTFHDGTCLRAYAGGASFAVAAFGRLAGEWSFDPDNQMDDEERAQFSAIARSMYTPGLQGLNVLAIGDSLFDGDDVSGSKQWIGLLAKECKWNLTNLGHDGWTVAYDPASYAPGQHVRSSMYDYLMNHSDIYRYAGSNASYTYGKIYDKKPEDVDLILLEGGTNDYGWNMKLGTVADRDGSTTLGAWNCIIERLLADYPNAQIVLVTSWHIDETRSDGARRMDFVADGMKSLYQTNFASNERVKLLDAGDPALSNISMYDGGFRFQYAVAPNDKNHLNESGMQLMANNMLPLLWEMLGNRM